MHRPLQRQHRNIKTISLWCKFEIWMHIYLTHAKCVSRKWLDRRIYDIIACMWAKLFSNENLFAIFYDFWWRWKCYSPNVTWTWRGIARATQWPADFGHLRVKIFGFVIFFGLNGWKNFARFFLERTFLALSWTFEQGLENMRTNSLEWIKLEVTWNFGLFKMNLINSKFPIV